MRNLNAIILFFIAFGVYLYTLHPTVAPYRDSGDLVVAAHTLGVAHPPGYPLYVLSGKIADAMLPWGNSAYRINVLSAVCGAAALLLLAQLLPLMAVESVVLPFAFLIMAFSPAYWRLSQVSEMYSYNALLAAVFILIAALFSFRSSADNTEMDTPLLYLLGFVGGFAAGNHQTIVFLFPGLLALLPRRSGWRASHYLGALLFFAVGLSVYLFLPIRSSTHPLSNWGDPESFARLLRLMTRSDYGGMRLHPEQSSFHWSAASIIAHCVVYARSLGQQFTWPAVIAGAVGLWYARKDKFFTFLIAGLLISGPFFVIFSNLPPQEKTTLPILEPHLILPGIIFMVFIALGLARLAAFRFGGVVIFALAVLSFASHVSLCNYRQHYFAYDYGKHVLATVEPNGIIYDPDDSTAFITTYLQVVEKKRLDVKLAAFFRTRWGYELLKKRYPDILPAREIASGQELATTLLDYNRVQHPVFAELPVKFPGNYLSYPAGVMARLSSDTEYRPSGAPFEFYAGHNRQRQMPEYDFFTDQIISYYAAAHNNLGLALSAQKQAGAAEREYMRALAIQPDLAAAYNNLGSLRFAQGRYQEAEKLFTRVVELSPGRSSGFYNLGLTCKAQHRNNEARDAFMRAWESDRNPDAGNELGLAALNSGNAQAAAAIFNEIIGRYPSHLSAYYNLGLSLMKLGNYKESRKCFEHYLNGVQDPAERREVIEFLNLLHK